MRTHALRWLMSLTAMAVLGCDGDPADPPASPEDAAVEVDVEPDAELDVEVVDPICEAERRRCAEDGIEVCVEGRAWAPLGPCPGGTVCEGGACVDVECAPECQGRICGADGCGGVCGACEPGEVCTVDGLCDPPPPRCGDDVCNGDEDCATCPADCGNCCGDGACGADRGEDCTTCPADCGCPEGEVCSPEATCQACAPQCDGRACGDDGCGGVCGDCPDGVACESGRCDVPCVPACDGRACGGDGCGGACGACPGEQRCTAEGACVDPPTRCGDGACDPDEDCATCPADCGNCCGDGVCAAGAGENCATCPADCGCPEGEACDAVDQRCEAVCATQCAGRNCGDDGCGGVCGACAPDQACEAGVCRDVCQPACDGRACGGDGCGGACGECAGGEQCADGICEAICTPVCDGRACGPDGCMGFCGVCDIGAFCTEAGVCEEVCVPRCAGRECGDNGCGGDCGGCGPDEVCSAEGVCAERCVPLCAGRICGGDGCGGLCGECPEGSACAPGGVCVGGDCDCQGDDVCLDGICRAPDALCAAENPAGQCPGGRVCLAGVCVDRGAGCGESNPTGVCPAGEACRDGACEALDASILCDDDNPCTDDLYDPTRNACVNVPVVAVCSDGNACTADVCLDGACVGDPIVGCVEPPTVEPLQSPTNQGDVIIRGTKPAGASVQIDGAEAVPESPEAEWALEVQLQPGENVFEIGSRSMGVESATVTVTVVYDITPPTLNVTPDGGLYRDGITITVSTDEPATVYYTDDGGTPDRWSKRFGAIKRIRVFNDVRFRFRAVDAAGNWSEGETVSEFEISGEGTDWRAEAPLPGALIHPAVTATAAGVYAIGGSVGDEPQAGVWRYAGAGDGWVAAAALPHARTQAAAAAVDAAVYVVGGQADGIPLNAVLRLAGSGAEAWQALSPMPTTRFGLTVNLAQGRLYAFGGKTNGGVVLDTTERYDVGTDTWVNDIPAMPRPRHGHSTVLDGGRLYVIGGEDEAGVPIAEVDVFDTTTLAWSDGPPLPTPRAFAAAARTYNVGGVAGGAHDIVIAGGRLADGDGTATVESLVLPDLEWRVRRPLDQPRHSAGAAAWDVPHDVDTEERRVFVVGGLTGGGGIAGSAASADLLSYGHQKDYLRRRPPLADGRFAHAALELNGRFYVLGGRNFQATDAFWAYDPETGRSLDLPPLPSVQNALAAVELDGAIYAIGGANQFNVAVPTLRRYDPAARRWSALRPMISARQDATAVALDGEIWVMGGDNNGAQQAVEIYDPATDRWRAGPLLPAGRSAARAVVHDGEIVLTGGVDPAGGIYPSNLILRGGAWVASSEDRYAWHQVALIGDHQLAFFGGRTGAGPTNALHTDSLVRVALSRPVPADDNLFTALDRAAVVSHHGRIYLIGGNSTAEVGPEGVAEVSAALVHCFNGVLDGREVPTGDVVVNFDSGGGCPGRQRHQQAEGLDQLRLLNGNALGRRSLVQARRQNGTWGFICHDLWDTPDANVACRQIFGPGVVGRATRNGDSPNRGYIYDNLECRGSEARLVDCPHVDERGENCNIGEGALLECNPAP